MSIVANSFEPLFNTGTIVSSESTSGSILNFGAGYKSISITNLSFNTVSYVKIGVGSVTATTADFPILPGAQVTLKKDSIAQTISYITPSGGGRLEIIAGQGHSASGLTTYSLPALDFPFAAQKNTNDIVSGSNLITFTRASSATFVGSNGLIQTAGVDVPRFDHNPTTGESLGLLVEEQRTNLLLRSEEFDGASWSLTNASVSANVITSPDGLSTAEKIVENTATGGHVCVQSVAGLADSTTYTFSVFCKADGRSWVAPTITDKTGVLNRVWFNVSTGQQGATNGTVSAFTATQFPDGWWRLSVSASSGIGVTNVGVRVSLGSADNNASYTGNGTSGVFLWGAQLEAGVFPTSYISTTTAAATRSADVASITGANFSSWYNQTQGTTFIDTTSVSSNIGFTFAISDGSDSNRIAQFKDGSNVVNRLVVAGSQNNAGNVLYSSVQARVRSLVSALAGNTIMCVNGTLGTASTQSPLPTVDRIAIGSGALGTNILGGTIHRLAYYPRRLSNTELQMITQ